MARKALSTISLDFRFSDDRVDSVRYDSSLTVLDYEIAIWDPAGLLAPYANTFGTDTYQGLTLLSDDASFSIRRDVGRRRTEMERFLELGKTLVMFVPAPESWYINTGEKRYSGTGRNRQVTSIVTQMDLRESFPFELRLVGATGENMKLLAGDPFASFWREMKDLFYYDAHMAAHPGTPLVAIDGTDYPVAALAQVGKGTVILLPQPEIEQAEQFDDEDFESPEAAKAYREEERERAANEKRFLDALFELIGDVRSRTGDYSLPEWAEGVLLPGEEDVAADLIKAEDRLSKLLTQIDKKKATLTTVRERKLLFTGTGKAFENRSRPIAWCRSAADGTK